jgi:hypothetical protein
MVNCSLKQATTASAYFSIYNQQQLSTQTHLRSLDGVINLLKPNGNNTYQLL